MQHNDRSHDQEEYYEGHILTSTRQNPHRRRFKTRVTIVCQGVQTGDISNWFFFRSMLRTVQTLDARVQNTMQLHVRLRSKVESRISSKDRSMASYVIFDYYFIFILKINNLYFSYPSF